MSPVPAQVKACTSTLVLLTKGAFCTPRSVIRSMTIKSRPSSDEVICEMRKLHDEGVGVYCAISEKEKVFYKLLPTDDNKDVICKYVDFNVYKENFEKDIDKFITSKQRTRLLLKCPHMDDLVANYNYEL